MPGRIFLPFPRLTIEADTVAKHKCLAKTENVRTYGLARHPSMLATLDIARLIVSHRQSALAGAGRVFELKGGVLEQRLSGVARELAM